MNFRWPRMPSAGGVDDDCPEDMYADMSFMGPGMDYESCPQCRGPMVPKRGRHGPFRGCAAFPKCHGSRSS
jgi:hypothetical protein